MNDDPFRLAIIGGSVARAAGREAGACPHPAGSAMALAWLHGFDRPRQDTVSRETRRPGRGRPLIGDRREWSRHELKLLATCLAAGMSRRLAGIIIDRSAQAVRTKLSRGKRKARAACKLTYRLKPLRETLEPEAKPYLRTAESLIRRIDAALERLKR